MALTLGNSEDLTPEQRKLLTREDLWREKLCDNPMLRALTKQSSNLSVSAPESQVA